MENSSCNVAVISAWLLRHRLKLSPQLNTLAAKQFAAGIQPAMGGREHGKQGIQPDEARQPRQDCRV